MLKKSFIVVMIILLIIGICGNVKAVESGAKLNIVQSESEIKQLENSQGNISSKVVAYNNEAGTITMQLSVNNTKPTYENTEILIIVDENLANDTDKINKYVSQVSNLTSIAIRLNIKVGIIGMRGTVNGTESDAEVLIYATDDAQAVITALENMNSEKITYNSNLQSAIKLAKSSYSKNVNKILINTYENSSKVAIEDCGDIAYEEMYNIDTATLLRMYQEFTKVKDTNMTSITAKVYFPKEIINNYHITLEENVENVDATKYETDGYITWNIDTLKTGETANLQYTLQIDDIGNTSLLSKTIATNEKVEITYQDGMQEEYTATLSSSPKVQLVNNQEQQNSSNNSSKSINNNNDNNSNDNNNAGKTQNQDSTTSNGNIPQTGVNSIIIVSILSFTMLAVIIMYKKYNEYKDI